MVRFEFGSGLGLEGQPGCSGLAEGAARAFYAYESPLKDRSTRVCVRVSVCVCVCAVSVRHCCSLAAICKVNVVENNIHLSTHPSPNCSITPHALSRPPDGAVRCDSHHINGE